MALSNAGDTRTNVPLGMGGEYVISASVILLYFGDAPYEKKLRRGRAA
jgi:hypothetical protein